MMNRKFWITLSTAVAVFCAVGCGDKNKGDEKLRRFNGEPEITGLPSFVSPGDTYTVECKGVRTMDTTKISYIWSMPWLEDKNWLLPTVNITISDSLASFLVSCTASAYDFSQMNAQMIVTVVDPLRSISGISHNPDGGVFVDERDGREYHYTSIGGLDWFDSNLAYEDVGLPYDNCIAAKDIFGGYYTWNEAIEACPEGWRIPTEDDWKKLAEAVTGESFEGEYPAFLDAGRHTMALAKFNNGTDYMWEIWPQMNVDNSTFLNILPTGYGVDSGEKGYYFTGIDSYAFFWTGTEVNDEKAVARYFTVVTDKKGNPVSEILAKVAEKQNFFFSVRPVRDSE